MMAADDARWILALTGPRVLAANAGYCRKMELTDALFKKSAKIVTKALAGHNHRTRDELGEALERGGVKTTGDAQRLAYIMMHLELTSVVTSGARRGKQFTYALMDERVPATRTRTREEMLIELALRYFATRGPATVYDYAWWSGLTIAEAKKSVQLLDGKLSSEAIDDTRYWFVGDTPPRPRRGPEAHLLPNYDEYFIGFKDRSAILNVVKEMSLLPGHPMFTLHVVTLNGQIVGGWKRSVGAKAATIEITLAIKPKPDERKAIDRAVKRYAEFLVLPMAVTWM
jgi:hypothetical protein